jgi:hypothetical protein
VIEQLLNAFKERCAIAADDIARVAWETSFDLLRVQESEEQREGEGRHLQHRMPWM